MWRLEVLMVEMVLLIPLAHLHIFSPTSGEPTLQCFDSQSAKPDRKVTCAVNESCYAEYYALKASEHLVKKGGPASALAHFYDRFCVHEHHCLGRGLLDNNCLEVGQLDEAVRLTFFSKLRSERLDPRRLVYSRFCCCSNSNFCNNLSPQIISKHFNISLPIGRRLAEIDENGMMVGKERGFSRQRTDKGAISKRFKVRGSNGSSDYCLDGWVMLFGLLLFVR